MRVTPEESEFVQRRLFELGYAWRWPLSKTVQYTGEPYLFFALSERCHNISYETSEGEVFFNDEPREEITFSEFKSLYCDEWEPKPLEWVEICGESSNEWCRRQFVIKYNNEYLCVNNGKELGECKHLHPWKKIRQIKPATPLKPDDFFNTMGYKVKSKDETP